MASIGGLVLMLVVAIMLNGMLWALQGVVMVGDFFTRRRQRRICVLVGGIIVILIGIAIMGLAIATALFFNDFNNGLPLN